MIKVVQVWYDDNPEYSVQTGLVFELEDGRMLSHSQDGFVIPLTEVTDLASERLTAEGREQAQSTPEEGTV